MTEMKEVPAMEYPLVIVDWEDSHGDGFWHTLSEIRDDVLVCRSIGWLVHDGEKSKVVAPHLSLQDQDVPMQGFGILTIPTPAIVRMDELRPVAPSEVPPTQ